MFPLSPKSIRFNNRNRFFVPAVLLNFGDVRSSTWFSKAGARSFLFYGVNPLGDEEQGIDFSNLIDTLLTG